jgi:hypothetical protein
MPKLTVTRQKFLEDRQGRTFADVLDDRSQPFDDVLRFFNDDSRQRRMEESEVHHNRAPLAGVVRELEAQQTINQFLAALHPRRSQRFRQAIGVVVRMIMEGRGWEKTGRKGSLGIRNAKTANTPRHNSGGLAFWFIRGERYELKAGMPYRTVRARQRRLTDRIAAKQPKPTRTSRPAPGSSKS